MFLALTLNGEKCRGLIAQASTTVSYRLTKTYNAKWIFEPPRKKSKNCCKAKRLFREGLAQKSKFILEVTVPGALWLQKEKVGAGNAQLLLPFPCCSARFQLLPLRSSTTPLLAGPEGDAKVGVEGEIRDRRVLKNVCHGDARGLPNYTCVQKDKAGGVVCVCVSESVEMVRNCRKQWL